MWDNIGGIIKSAAKILCCISVVACIVIGLALFFTQGVVSGLAVIILGSLLSWWINMLLYGFGQIIENTDLLVYYKEKEQKSGHKNPPPKPDAAPKSWKCECGNKVFEDECSCGRKKPVV